MSPKQYRVYCLSLLYLPITITYLVCRYLNFTNHGRLGWLIYAYVVLIVANDVHGKLAYMTIYRALSIEILRLYADACIYSIRSYCALKEESAPTSYIPYPT